MVMVVDSVAAYERGAALGVRLMINRLSQVLAPLAFVWVAGAGLPTLFLAHAALVAIAAVVLLAWTRRPAPGAA
jgi:hypothetical protein